MKDYTDKINSREEVPSVVQEPTLAMTARPTTRHTGKRGDSKTMLEMSMPCFAIVSCTEFANNETSASKIIMRYSSPCLVVIAQE